jgi:hypothetical protein
LNPSRRAALASIWRKRLISTSELSTSAPRDGGSRRVAAPQLSAAQSMYPTAAAAKSALSPDSPEAPALAIAARAAAARALQLDRANGEAYFAIGISYGFERAWAVREANFLRAEAMSPGFGVMSPGFGVMGDVHVGLLREVGRLRDARELNRRTVADDPFGPEQLSTLIILTTERDGREAAERLLQRARLAGDHEARFRRGAKELLPRLPHSDRRAVAASWPARQLPDAPDGLAGTDAGARGRH